MIKLENLQEVIIISTITISKNALSLIIIVALIGVIGFLAYQLYFPKTGYATSQGDYQGYSSYEEMMQAHHGPSATQQGCSGVSVQSGEMAEYGISFDNDGFSKMLEYEQTVRLASQYQVDKVIGLDIRIDCCGFDKIQASGNCACGHHLALVGLAKYLATKGYDKQYIQAEIDKWKDIINKEDIGACG